MARNRKKKALYEVIGRAGNKSRYDKTLEHLHPGETSEAEPNGASSTTPTFGTVPVWPKRPKAVQFNAGRIEISVPYQIAVALLLGIILLIFVALWLGQRAGQGQSTAAFGLSGPAAGEGGSEILDLPTTAGRSAKTIAGAPAKDNVIVLVQYKARADLVPVQKHFAEYGIGTEIVREGGRYFLITKDRFESTEKPGSDGYIAKQRIREIGAKYKGKAPEGYETFAPHYFRDAYGKKIE